MFKYNQIMRVFRESADDDGDASLGISGGDVNGIFAGADEEWEDNATLEDFAELSQQELVNASEGGVEPELDESVLDEEEQDGDSGDGDDDDSDDSDDESDEDDEDIQDDEEDSEEDDYSDEDEEDSEVDNDDISDDDSDDTSDDDDGDSDGGNATVALKEFSDLADEGDKLSKAMQDAVPVEFSQSAFEEKHKDLYSKFDEANSNYQQAILDENKEDMAKYNREMMTAQTEISRLASAETSNGQAAFDAAKGKVQDALNHAIKKAQALYPELDPSSDVTKQALIRVVNANFKAKLDEGESHVRAFIESVEEVAVMKDLVPQGQLSEDQVDSKKAKKTKHAVKKRVAASKRQPKRNAGRKAKGQKLNASNMKNLSGKAFFEDKFVKDLGIKTDDY